MVMTQPLYRDSVVLFMLEAIRLYPKQEGLLVSLQLQHRQLEADSNGPGGGDGCASECGVAGKPV